MKISNNKTTSIIETDEVRAILKSKNSYDGTFNIQFYYKNIDASNVWNFKTEEERNKVLEIIKQKLGVIEINDTDLVL